MNIVETNLSFGKLSSRNKTNKAILHHSASTFGDAKTFHKWHKDRGWAGVGYHFVILKNGTIERGRPENSIGAHASGSNSDSIGICLVGNFEVESPTNEQINSCIDLLNYLKKKYGFSQVKRHKDVSSTSCPGKNFPFNTIVNGTRSANSSNTVSTTPKVGFKVRIKVSALNYRKGAGTEYRVVGTIRDKGVYTIIETKKSKDGGTWGKLKSGAGWINISTKYVTRL